MADLEAIRDHIARDSDVYAARYIESILTAIERVQSFPGMGRRLPEEPADEALREIIHQNHRIIYRLRDDVAFILTVVDARRDLTANEPRPWDGS